MIDVEHRARRAGEAARAEAAARARHLRVPTTGTATSSQHRWRRGSRPVVGGAVTGALAVLVAVLLVGQGARPSPSVPPIDPVGPSLVDVVTEPVAVDGELPVPPVGEAIPAYLEDGTPVFVSHPAEGHVHVLGGENPFRFGSWSGRLVAWCPSSGYFEDLRGDGRFNAWGDYEGGPPPYALTDHAADLADDGRTVRVTGAVDATRSREDQRAQQAARGSSCGDGSGDPPGGTGAESHEPPEHVPPLDGTGIPHDRWVWARIRVGGVPGDPRVCDIDGACPQASPRLAGPTQHAGTPVAAPDDLVVTGLVRRTREGVVVLSAAEPDREADEPSYTDAAPGLLPLPEPGEVLAERYGPAQDPVFVARDEDGGVHVLDATSPARESSLVGWCATSGAFLDDTGIRWGPAGEGVGGGAWTDLGRYPAEIVEHGELRGVLVTGELEIEWSWTGSGLVGPAAIGPDCTTAELVRHLPGERTDVVEHGRLAWPPYEPTWTWVRMEVAMVDGELLLCAVAGPQDCGEPGPAPDPTNADCYDDIGPGGLCPPELDPVIVTAGAGPTEAPALLLARASEDGRTVDVRHPAALPDH